MLQILCHEGYGEDAGILLRSLFELTVDSRYITRSSSQKPRLRWLDYDAVTRYELARVIRDDPYFAMHRANAPEGGQIPATIVIDAQTVQAKYGFWTKADGAGELHLRCTFGAEVAQQALEPLLISIVVFAPAHVADIAGVPQQLRLAH